MDSSKDSLTPCEKEVDSFFAEEKIQACSTPFTGISKKSLFFDQTSLFEDKDMSESGFSNSVNITVINVPDDVDSTLAGMSEQDRVIVNRSKEKLDVIKSCSNDDSANSLINEHSRITLNASSSLQCDQFSHEMNNNKPCIKNVNALKSEENCLYLKSNIFNNDLCHTVTSMTANLSHQLKSQPHSFSEDLTKQELDVKVKKSLVVANKFSIDVESFHQDLFTVKDKITNRFKTLPSTVEDMIDGSFPHNKTNITFQKLNNHITSFTSIDSGPSKSEIVAAEPKNVSSKTFAQGPVKIESGGASCSARCFEFNLSDIPLPQGSFVDYNSEPIEKNILKNNYVSTKNIFSFGQLKNETVSGSAELIPHSFKTRRNDCLVETFNRNDLVTSNLIHIEIKHNSKEQGLFLSQIKVESTELNEHAMINVAHSSQDHINGKSIISTNKTINAEKVEFGIVVGANNYDENSSTNNDILSEPTKGENIVGSGKASVPPKNVSTSDNCASHLVKMQPIDVDVTVEDKENEIDKIAHDELNVTVTEEDVYFSKRDEISICFDTIQSDTFITVAETKDVTDLKEKSIISLDKNLKAIPSKVKEIRNKSVNEVAAQPPTKRPRIVIDHKENDIPLEVFISSNAHENVDNNDPQWNKYKHLTSDELRYERVREVWRNSDIPNANKNMSSYNWRARNQLSPVPYFINNTKIYYRTLGGNVRDVINKARDNAELLFNQKVRALEVKRDSRYDEADDKLQYNLSRTDSSWRPYFYSQYRSELDNIWADYSAQYDQLLAGLEERISGLDKAEDEITTVCNFYKGLGADESRSHLSDRQLNCWFEREDTLNKYEVYYF